MNQTKSSPWHLLAGVVAAICAVLNLIDPARVIIEYIPYNAIIPTFFRCLRYFYPSIIFAVGAAILCLAAFLKSRKPFPTIAFIALLLSAALTLWTNLGITFSCLVEAIGALFDFDIIYSLWELSFALYLIVPIAAPLVALILTVKYADSKKSVTPRTKRAFHLPALFAGATALLFLLRNILGTIYYCGFSFDFLGDFIDYIRAYNISPLSFWIKLLSAILLTITYYAFMKWLSEAAPEAEAAPQIPVAPVSPTLPVNVPARPTYTPPMPPAYTPPMPPAYTPPAAATVDPVTELQRYKALADAGVITPEEFEAKKKQLLNL